jgi:hypothetical protein
MSALITDKLVTPCGSITNATLGGYVDAAGNVFGSAGFLSNFVVDYAGNLGVISAVVNNCTFVAEIIGGALEPGPWEMAQAGVETIGAHLGEITNNYINAGNLTNFTSANTIGYMAGNINGTGTFTIQNGPQSIGGTTYSGNGLTIFTGVNTASGILNMEPGTKIQFGEDCSNTTTRWAGNLTIQTGAVATQMTGYTANTYLCQALTNTGTYNVIGCGTCGAGGLGLATTVANNGVINIDDAMWRNQSTWSGTGTVNVKDGGTFQLGGSAIGSTTRININGCGWKNASCVEQGALNATTTGFAYQARVHVQSAACIKTNQNVNVEFAGLLTGSAPLTVSNLGTPKPNGIVQFTNTGNTYFGTMTVDGTTLSQSTYNSLQYAKIVLANGGRIGTSGNTSQVVGSLASTDSTTYWSSGDFTINTIKANGITTYAGRLLWNGGSNTALWFLNGGAENELTMTGTGNTGSVYPRNGARLILQGATFTGVQGQVRAQTGATVSAGTSTTASVTNLYFDATSKLEVRAAGAGAGLITVTAGFVPSAGWKVDLPDAMAAGTYPIVKYSGTATTVLPTVGINNSGRTVTFAYNNAVNPKVLNMILS